eukprot:3422656-Amphidinium_carterae.5
MFFKLVGAELKVKEDPEWSKQAQIFLRASFRRLNMMIDGINKDVIVEGSKPGCFQNAHSSRNGEGQRSGHSRNVAGNCGG